MTDRQKHLLKVCVGFLLANIRNNEQVTLGVLLDTYNIAGEIPGKGIFQKEELEELLTLLHTL